MIAEAHGADADRRDPCGRRNPWGCRGPWSHCGQTRGPWRDGSRHHPWGGACGLCISWHRKSPMGRYGDGLTPLLTTQAPTSMQSACLHRFSPESVPAMVFSIRRGCSRHESRPESREPAERGATKFIPGFPRRPGLCAEKTSSSGASKGARLPFDTRLLTRPPVRPSIGKDQWLQTRGILLFRAGARNNANGISPKAGGMLSTEACLTMRSAVMLRPLPKGALPEATDASNP